MNLWYPRVRQKTGVCLCMQAGKLSRSPTRGVMDSRGVLTVNVIRAMGLEVSRHTFRVADNCRRENDVG